MLTCRLSPLPGRKLGTSGMATLGFRKAGFCSSRTWTEATGSRKCWYKSEIEVLYRLAWFRTHLFGPGFRYLFLWVPYRFALLSLVMFGTIRHFGWSLAPSNTFHKGKFWGALIWCPSTPTRGHWTSTLVQHLCSKTSPHDDRQQSTKDGLSTPTWEGSLHHHKLL